MRGGNEEVLDPYESMEFCDDELLPCVNPFTIELGEGTRLAELFWSGIYHLSLYQSRCLNSEYDLYPFDRLHIREKIVVNFFI